MSYDLFPAVDADYNFPPEVRGALAASLELRNTVLPMTQIARNNLTGADLWDGRIVFNTTSKRLNRYDLASTSWLDVSTDPPGIVKMYAGGAVPSYHALCDGTVVSRTGIYAGLFAAIGTVYNTGGEGITNFRLPDLRGRVPVGFDVSQAEFNVLGETGGEKTHVITVAEMAVHTHVATQAAHSHGGNSVNDGGHHHSFMIQFQSDTTAGGGTTRVTDVDQTTGGAGTNKTATTTNDGTHNHVINSSTPAITVNNAGTGTGHNNLQPYLAINFIITL